MISDKGERIRGKIIIEKDKCKGCEYCIIYCPKKCITLSHAINIRGVHYAEFSRPETCIACGICGRVCPEVCIEVIQRIGGPLYQKVEHTISKLIDSGLDKIKGTEEQKRKRVSKRARRKERKRKTDNDTG